MEKLFSPAKRPNSNFVLFCTIFFSLFSLLGRGLFGQDSWELRKDSEGIQVFTRPVEGSSFQAFKGICTCEVAVEPLITVLKDVDNFTNWLPLTKEAKLIERKTDRHVHYTLSPAPWPVSDRDAVFQFRYVKQADGAVKVFVTCLPGYEPLREGVIRIVHSEGYWLLEPLASGKTQITYELFADPNGNIPAWLANQTVVSTPFDALKAICAQAKK